MTVSCFTNSATALDTDSDSTLLRVGALPTSECLSLFYAERIGLTDLLGVKVVLFNSVRESHAALCNGLVDVALTDTVAMKGYGLDSVPQAVAIRLATDSLFLIASDSSKIRGTGALRDKLVAYWRFSASDEARVRLQSFAGYNEGDVFFVQVGSIPLRYKMLTQHLVDAAFLPQPYASEAIRLGHRRLRCAATDTLQQSVWAVLQTSKRSAQADSLLHILLSTPVEANDTLRYIMQDTYKLWTNPI